MSDEQYRKRMANKKAYMDARIAASPEQRGVVIVLKGKGKGKSSSAFGTMARCLGHGKRCSVIQFIKGRMETGEVKLFKNLLNVDWHIMGHGFSWETQDRDLDKQAAEKAWAIAEQVLMDQSCHTLVLDEIGYMFKYGYLQAERVAEMIRLRPKMQNVILTGRTMAHPILQVADTISIVDDERHAFRLGVKAQAGIEY